MNLTHDAFHSAIQKAIDHKYERRSKANCKTLSYVAKQKTRAATLTSRENHCQYFLILKMISIKLLLLENVSRKRDASYIYWVFLRFAKDRSQIYDNKVQRIGCFLLYDLILSQGKTEMRISSNILLSLFSLFCWFPAHLSEF